jgi:hypothetical protein
VDFDDPAADMTRLRVPGHVIAHFEFGRHLVRLRSSAAL